MKNLIGSKRLVVGAHYGLMDWLAQRVTAVLMALYTIVLLIFFFSGGPWDYAAWAGLFARQWFKLFTLVVALGLYYHVWVGMRNILMDYIKPLAVRLLLQMTVIGLLLAYAAWTVQILWRV